MGKINPEATKVFENGILTYLGTLYPEDFADVINKSLLKRRMNRSHHFDYLMSLYIKRNKIDLSNPQHVKQLQEDILDVDNFRVRFFNP